MMDKHGISRMIKLGVTLAAFSAAACVMLAFVHIGTEKKREERRLTDLEAALGEVFPQADSFEPIAEIESADVSVSIESGYAAVKDGEIAGAVLSLSRGAYGGPIKVLVGVSAEGHITGVKILEHSETPGLGAHAASPSYFVDKQRKITFHGQFAGKKVTDDFTVKNDVIAITASTVTSHAVSASVKAAGLAVKAWLAGENVEAVSGASTGAGE